MPQVHMFLILTGLFIIVPALEIMLIIKVGQGLGLWLTLSVIILTALCGAGLAKNQGRDVVARLRNGLGMQNAMVTTLLEGVLVFAAGLTLLTPGFITDATGLALLVPPIRQWIAKKIENSSWFEKKKQSINFVNFNQAQPPHDDVIDI